MSTLLWTPAYEIPTCKETLTETLSHVAAEVDQAKALLATMQKLTERCAAAVNRVELEKVRREQMYMDARTAQIRAEKTAQGRRW